MILKYISKILILAGMMLPALGISQNCFSLKIDHVEASPGDTVALNVSATGFNSVIGMQYSVEWNPNELELAAVGNYNLPGLAESNFGVSPASISAGRLGMSWIDPNLQGVTKLDGESLYTLYYIVKQITEERSFIQFAEQPTPSEVVFPQDVTMALPVGLAGAVHLELENQVFNPLQVASACAYPTGCSAFSGIIGTVVSGGTAPYAYDWSGPLNFVSNESNLDSLVAGTYNLRVIDAEGHETFARFNVNQVEGQSGNFFVGIAIECNDTLETAKLLAASFGTDTLGLTYEWSNGVVDSRGSFTSSIEVPLSGTYRVTATNSSGCQSVSETVRPAEICENLINPLVLDIQEVTVEQGDTANVLVFADGFVDLTQLSFSINWDRLGLKPLFITPHPQLENATITNDSLNIGFNWTNSEPISIVGEPILLLEFVADFSTGAADLEFNGFPNSIFATGEGQENIAVITNDGAVIVGSEGPVELNIASGIFSSGAELCLPVSVVNFDDIVGMQFQLAWDTSVLAYTQVRNFALPQLSEVNFEEDRSDQIGKLKVSWVDNSLSGQSLAANDILFEVCFTPKNIEDTTVVWVDETNFPVEFINKNLDQLSYTSKIGNISIIQRVWPGDTDVNGLVNHFDLFNIGLAFGSTGPRRGEASTSWQGQFSIPWEGATTGSNTNYRFADTNGDGIVSELDLDAIDQNWGRTYELNIPGFAPLKPRNSGAPLFVKLDTLYTGAQVNIPVHLGTEDQPAQDVYSIGFTIKYDPSLIQPGSFSFSLEDSWLATPGTDLLQVSKAFPTDGQIDIAITRTDGQNISGYGIIGRSSVTIEDVIFGVRDDKPFEFIIENVRTIDVSEREASVSPQTTPVVVSVVSSTVQLLPSHLVNVYPVPTQGVLQVTLPEDLKVQRLALFDMNGRQLLNVVPTGLQHTLDLSTFSDGLYNLKVIAENGVLVKRVSKN